MDVSTLCKCASRNLLPFFEQFLIGAFHTLFPPQWPGFFRPGVRYRRSSSVELWPFRWSRSLRWLALWISLRIWLYRRLALDLFVRWCYRSSSKLLGRMGRRSFRLRNLFHWSCTLCVWG
jgi:hypothetical protein